MAEVYDRKNKIIMESAKSSRYAGNPDYIMEPLYDPDRDTVKSFANWYWTDDGTTVSVVDRASRDAIDAARIQQSKDERVLFEKDHYDLESAIRATAELTVDDSNRWRGHVRDLYDEINAIRVAAGYPAIPVPNIPDLTYAQMRDVVFARMDSYAQAQTKTKGKP